MARQSGQSTLVNVNVQEVIDKLGAYPNLPLKLSSGFVKGLAQTLNVTLATVASATAPAADKRPNVTVS